MADNENSDNRENRKPTKYVHSWKSIWIYVQCYFVTIASILGTGILGLPDTTWRSGFTPFLTSFLIDYVMRALSILFFVDLLQKAQVYLLSNQENNPELVALNEINNEDDLNDCQSEASTNDVLRNIWSRNEDNYNNLHQLSLLYMPYYLWIPFDVTVFLMLVAIIISYSLAGPQAFAQLLGIQNYGIVIPFFVWILAFSIAIFGDIIKVTISILTLFKCSILTAVVIVTIDVGAKIDNPIHNDFSHMGSSFLMGTVALGGVINILPILYVKIEPIKQQVRCFFFASFAGLTTCAIFIILWVVSVLHIVPQTDAQCRENFSLTSNKSGTLTTSHLLTNIIPPEDCYKYTLKRSEENGQISTVPLTEIILDFFPEYRWVGRMTQIFIAVSITVSYLAFGSALKSMRK
ncbi:uncharacterized protein LOC117121573 [Anneissia japonica]|uniref:uncharacterized protein LOC117121573 n=1 Tax=Anneissia japonica TaxID=1529436 RepID=UPI0014259A4D|nr:uncharacterized protein LOC117121573 [Anneissia japonica]